MSDLLIAMPAVPAPQLPVASGSDTRAFQVSRYLSEYIRHQRLKAGDPVPSEMSLSRDLGVSRSVVREAYRTLAATGVIDISNGKTPRVSRIDSLPISALMRHAMYTGQVTPLQILELRAALDRQAALLAAQHATAEQLSVLQGTLDQMRAAGPEGGAYIRHDVHFHALLAEASGNPLISLQVTALATAARYSIRSGEVKPTAPRNFAALLELHQAALRALNARDPAAAVAASEAHFAAAFARLLG